MCNPASCLLSGPADLPEGCGLSPGPKSNVFVERLYGDGTQPLPLPSSWQQTFGCKTAGGNGGGSGWSLPGPPDDNTPGPPVDREHAHLLSLGVVKPSLSLTSLPVLNDRSPTSC